MPVSTRSKVLNQEQNGQENTNLNLPFRNPHQGLKEKMKALTLLYEQQKRASFSLRNPNQSPKPEDQRFKTHQLLDSCKKGERFHRQDGKDSNFVDEETKENNVANADRIFGINSVPVKPSGPSSTVIRKLSMGNGARKATAAEKGEKLENLDACGSRISVFVRLRPMGKKERENGSRCCVKILNKRDVYLTEFTNDNDYLRLKRLRVRHFTFDSSFPDTTTQREVYSTTTGDLLEAVLEGRNGSVFCYGATGAGKTYTMLGTMENPGVMVLAIKDLFAKVRQRSLDGNHVVHLSYLEVYNETVRDLLSPGRPLILREDKQVMALLQRGNQNRTTEPTRCNETSSRSHAILQVIVEYRTRDAFMNTLSRIGKLSLIDLAGSERAVATDQRTLRSLEGANINRSLLALSSCINALVEGKKHIPYRNSKLTQLLKDSLGGSCNTVMIANISPSDHSFGETQNTLHWADRAKEIRVKGCEVNEEVVQVGEQEGGPDQAKLLLELQEENRELRVQLAKQQQKLLTLQAETLAAANNNNISQTPPSISSLMTPPSALTAQQKKKPRHSLLSGTCFTPESSKRSKAEEAVKELQLTVKALKMEMERMKREHGLQMKKQKEELMKDLCSKKSEKTPERSKETRRIVTRGSLRPKEKELKSPSHRFASPAATAKKRSFWDIGVANSPSLDRRKTRSHVHVHQEAPSMLLQPGFARPRTTTHMKH
ncbi:kinesin-like protein KIN-8A isoform X2 [Eutrema salsugineum]|uniref:kinesin-like protein KIN-8A isoform X2 n=1 Tax=Eutrema salsugineum TaxID=72664 RepID=UPI000CECF8A7|nr:kinesin-like protein KIN-8A isoform X2 [Eutrema salsugineum]